MMFTYDVWTWDLENEEDKEYLLQGVKEGFPIADGDSEIVASRQPNHNSVVENGANVDKELLSLISTGHYIIGFNGPKIISPLAAYTNQMGSTVGLFMMVVNPKVTL